DEIKAAWEGSEDLRKMGVFYNWAAAVNMGDGDGEYANPGDIDYREVEGSRGGPTGNVKGICPAGWHLPSDAEWNDLEGEIALSAAGVYSSIGPTPWPDDNGTNLRTTAGYRGAHGEKMKHPLVEYPEEPYGASKPAEEGGFSTYPVGYVNGGNSYSFFRTADFWSSSSGETKWETVRAWMRYLYLGSETVTRNTEGRGRLLSVRCKKNN
ncbi:MAG: fibrobacter succinogenes major paralogous domain-containing protein, partial [Dysgonamonadaceae bacterium]|nr:fibrobacter succinogenes major paralogous domain-containing protein [Dysgonamonadaceae bacterium]